MNEPKRLVAESQSALAHELLRAAQSERVPDVLRQRMAEGLAITLGVGSVGAGLSLGGANVGAQGGLAATQAAGIVGQSASALGSGAAATGSAGMGAAALTQGFTWAGASMWVKGALAVCALTGAAGLGTAVKHWGDGDVSRPAASLRDGASLRDSASVAENAAPARVDAPEPTIVNPESAPRIVEPRGVTDLDAERVATPPVEPDPHEVAPSARRAKMRSAGKAVGLAPASTAPSSDLGREVRMLDAARRAIIAGDAQLAREKLAQYSRAFPNGALRAEAASLAKTAADLR